MLNISGYSYLLCYRYQAKFNKAANFIKDQPKLLNIRTSICIFFYRNAFQSTDSEKKIRSSRIPRDLFETREGLLYGGVFLFLFLNSILWQKAQKQSSMSSIWRCRHFHNCNVHFVTWQRRSRHATFVTSLSSSTARLAVKWKIYRCFYAKASRTKTQQFSFGISEWKQCNLSVRFVQRFSWSQ